MALPQREFDFRCAALTDKLKYATGWKWNFFGAAYSTRLKELRKFLMELLEEIDKLVDDDESQVQEKS